jgi:hypothetical protein
LVAVGPPSYHERSLWSGWMAFLYAPTSAPSTPNFSVLTAFQHAPPPVPRPSELSPKLQAVNPGRRVVVQAHTNTTPAVTPASRRMLLRHSTSLSSPTSPSPRYGFSQYLQQVGQGRILRVSFCPPSGLSSKIASRSLWNSLFFVDMRLYIPVEHSMMNRINHTNFEHVHSMTYCSPHY